MTYARIALACALLAALAFAAVAKGQPGQGFDGVELTLVPAAGNVYMLQRPGGGGNIGVFVGPDGVLLVDALFAPLTARIKAAVKGVTSKDIRFLINTHIHVDHIDGNENMAAMGVLIFAHDNVRLRMLEQRTRIPRRGGTFGPQPPVAGRPVITYNDGITFHVNGEDVRAFLVPPAHTDGDTFVYFPGSDVLHLGDVFRTTSYPIVDVYNGGTLAGTIKALRMALDIAGPQTRIIPGHGLMIVGRDSVAEFLNMILDIRDRVRAMIAQGKSLDEVMAARITEAYDAKWGQEASWTADDFLPNVYNELGGTPRVIGR
jgi:glyoxylase-like metal-dependent hydrolase (beta-lactamase superfamily II)